MLPPAQPWHELTCQSAVEWNESDESKADKAFSNSNPDLLMKSDSWAAFKSVFFRTIFEKLDSVVGPRCVDGRVVWYQTWVLGGFWGWAGGIITNVSLSPLLNLHLQLDATLLNLHLQLDATLLKLHLQLEATLPKLHLQLDAMLLNLHLQLEATLRNLHLQLDATLLKLHLQLDATLLRLHLQLEATLPNLHLQLDAMLLNLHLQLDATVLELLLQFDATLLNLHLQLDATLLNLYLQHCRDSDDPVYFKGLRWLTVAGKI